jgi:competence protein ComEC
VVRIVPHAVLAAFCAGLVASSPAGAPRMLAPVALAGAAGFGVSVLRRHAAWAVAALAALSATAGLAWGGARLDATRTPALDLPVHVRGIVVVRSPPVDDGQGGRRALAGVERLTSTRGAVPGGTRVIISLPEGARGAAVRTGTRLQVSGRLVPAAGRRSPVWWRRHLARSAIAGRLMARRVRVVGRRGGLPGMRDAWREWVSRHAASGLAGDRGALVRGMALGGGSGLSEDAATAFRDAGLWHLLAVSGQNVAVVALAVLLGLRAMGAPRRGAICAAMATIVAYCLACDGGASVARAGVVGVLGVLAELRSAARERWYLLLVALAVLLAANPRAIGDPGLQLSFAAVIGLLAVAPPLADWLCGWMPRRVADLAALAAGAGLATAPVLAWHFGRLSLVGMALNVVAVPLAGPVVVTALAAILAGAIVTPLGTLLAWGAGMGAEALLAMARAAASVPGGAIDVPAAVAVPLLALPILPPAARWWLRRVPRDVPARAAARGGVARGPVAMLLAGTALILVVGWVGRGGAPAPWPVTPAVTALDVGQGDAILLRSPEGAAALVDTGTSRSPVPVLAALRRNGVEDLSLVVVTHDQEDHSGALPDVLARHRVALVAHPPLGPDAGDLRRDLDAARRHGVPVREIAAGAELDVGAWRLVVESPRGPPPAGSDPNPYSLTMLARAGPFDVLLTADAESDALRSLSLPAVDVLKVAHHGSADAGLADLLARLRPSTAVISVGAGNTYGHPTPETLAELRASGVRTLRTDLSGDVTVRAEGEGLAVDTEE